MKNLIGILLISFLSVSACAFGDELMEASSAQGNVKFLPLFESRSGDFLHRMNLILMTPRDRALCLSSNFRGKDCHQALVIESERRELMRYYARTKMAWASDEEVIQMTPQDLKRALRKIHFSDKRLTTAIKDF